MVLRTERMNNIEKRKRLEKRDDKKKSNQKLRKIANNQPVAYNKKDKYACANKKEVIDIASIKIKSSLHDDHGTWTVRARIKDPLSGKTIHRSKSTGLKVKDRTKRKAQDIQNDIEKQWEQEIRLRASSANNELLINPLVEYYVECWLNKKRDSIRLNTWSTYRQYADNYIIPFFKGIHVNELNTKLIQQFVDYYLGCGHKVSSYKKVHVVLSGALKCAIRDGVIDINYADKDHIELPREESFEGDYYTVEEIGLLLQGVEAAGEPMKSAIILALCYGLRRSEIIGLRWCDIDFNNRTMTISHTYVQDGSLVLDEDHTKSRASNRTLGLIESTIPYLESLKSRYDSLEQKTDKVVMWDDGRQVRPDYITSKLAKLQDEYNLKHIRLHDLRHTAASLLANEPDVSLLQVQQFMGHSDVRMTRHYSHVFDERNRNTSIKMNHVLSGISSFNELCSENCSESA